MNIKKIQPQFNVIVCTMDVYTADELKVGGIIDARKMKMTVKEFQTVVAVGPSVKNVNVGDLIKINPTRYGRMKHKDGSLKDGIIEDNLVEEFNLKTIELDHKKHLMIYDTDVDYVVKEYEMEDVPQDDIIVKENDLIV